jgi:hypothetical protein
MLDDDAEKEPESGMAVLVSLSPLAFGPEGLLAGRAEGIPMGASVQLEFQPYFLRYFGTAGIGPVFTTFPFYSEQGKDPGVQSAWAAGVEGRYQFKIAPVQFLVPSFGYQYSRLHYTLTGGQQGTTDLQGPVFGLELVLSALSSGVSDGGYDEGRSPSVYLTVEVRDLKGGDDTVNVSSPGWYFGLGVEL